MSEAATYLVDGKKLSANECRALFAGMSLLDRQLKVLERIEGDTVVDVGLLYGPGLFLNWSTAT